MNKRGARVGYRQLNLDSLVFPLVQPQLPWIHMESGSIFGGRIVNACSGGRELGSSSRTKIERESVCVKDSVRSLN